MASAAPIGIFDSGIGGLSVLREIRRRLPSADVAYVGDSRYCPYGLRPEAEIAERALRIARHLVARGSRLIVVACNTASSVALEALRAEIAVPVVGLEPAVKPAALQTRTGRIAVLATPRTAAGSRLARLIADRAGQVEVEVVAAHGLVELVEAGRLDDPEVEGTLGDLLRPLRARGVDTVVLGCTHYPFLRPALERVAGPAVSFVDSGEAIARRTHDLLAGDTAGSGTTRLATTGDAPRFAALAATLLRETAPVEALAL